MTEPTHYDLPFTGTHADPDTMDDLAKLLRSEVSNGYSPVMSSLTTAMSVDPPDALGFPELTAFLDAHKEARYATFANAWNFQDGTDTFTNAIEQIGQRYRSADAFAAASLRDIESLLPPPGTNSGITTAEEV